MTTTPKFSPETLTARFLELVNKLYEDHFEVFKEEIEEGTLKITEPYLVFELRIGGDLGYDSFAQFATLKGAAEDYRESCLEASRLGDKYPNFETLHLVDLTTSRDLDPNWAYEQSHQEEPSRCKPLTIAISAKLCNLVQVLLNEGFDKEGFNRNQTNAMAYKIVGWVSKTLLDEGIITSKKKA